MVGGRSHTVLHVRSLALTQILGGVVGDVRQLGQVESSAVLTALGWGDYIAGDRGDVTSTSGDSLHIGRGIGSPVRWIIIHSIRGGTR